MKTASGEVYDILRSMIPGLPNPELIAQVTLVLKATELPKVELVVYLNKPEGVINKEIRTFELVPFDMFQVHKDDKGVVEKNILGQPILF